jgi:biopolymer transport protein ExbD
MSWKVRHEGSPRSIDNLSLPQVVEGLQDGLWEPADEVMGPGDAEWVAIENHPQLAEAAADIEPPPPRVYDDETRLDMTALIDVTLVLLIFFILTTTYAALQKRLDAPGVSNQKVGPAVLTKEKVANQMVHVVVKMHDGKPVVQVEGNPVELNNVRGELRGYVRKTSHNQLLLEADDDVPHGVVVQIEDDARDAEIRHVNLVVP